MYVWPGVRWYICEHIQVSACSTNRRHAQYLLHVKYFLVLSTWFSSGLRGVHNIITVSSNLYCKPFHSIGLDPL